MCGNSGVAYMFVIQSQTQGEKKPPPTNNTNIQTIPNNIYSGCVTFMCIDGSVLLLCRLAVILQAARDEEKSLTECMKSHTGEEKCTNGRNGIRAKRGREERRSNLSVQSTSCSFSLACRHKAAGRWTRRLISFSTASDC